MNRIFEIKEEIAQAILNYLATKPYQEVFQFVQVLQNLDLSVKQYSGPPSQPPQDVPK